MMRVGWDSIMMDEHYEGDLVEVDNGTGIVRLDDGTTKGVPMECLYRVDGDS